MPSLREVMKSSDNTLIRTLSEDTTAVRQEVPRQVDHHFVRVVPAKPVDPKVVIISNEMCKEMGIEKDESEFEKLLSGSEVADGCSPWATAYGCHHRGSYMGQMGDGRAMSLCEVSPNGQRFEIQLKGAGRTPFNRTFDGKCVIRSCIREFLMSEHLHALGIPTTRALAVFTTGDSVMRQWVNHDTDRLEIQNEPGALTVRVAPSFIRFGHFEFFWRKENFDHLKLLADYAANRCYGLPTGEVSSYITLFEEIIQRSAKLVASWMGVGYVHGNMNSDNMSIHGLTLDFGPFGMMEDYKPHWNSWVATPHYGYSRQAKCMEHNCLVLSRCFIDLIEHVGGSPDDVQKVSDAQGKFYEYFTNEWNDIKRKKLGLSAYSLDVDELWHTLTDLMEVDYVDFTTVFRTLSNLDGVDSAGEALDKLVAGGIFRHGFPEGEREALWIKWLEAYLLLQRDSLLQKSVNPSIILRNYLALEAYSSFPDVSVLQSLHDALKTPFSDSHIGSKYYGPAPDWATSKPGVHQTT
eukprot:TRINITY_DN3829_c1_g1_i1.p1 TRINITY_DN3829_c1_g1~~TRINITY_DN3829_c1_g1_i1.p1  ORF type:complete len:545 (+),score=88.68 TRINITY_DN3829_c1_g1_i1:74-1636(+)